MSLPASLGRPLRRRPPSPSEPRKSPQSLPTNLRQTYTLSPEEREEFKALCPQECKAFIFWRRVADNHGLDYQSIMGVEDRPMSFTALPKGHGKWWCWPEALEVKKTPANHF